MMSKLMFSATKGARFVAVLFALVLALAALQAFGARSAEAGPNLVQGGSTGYSGVYDSGFATCGITSNGVTTFYTLSATAVNWTGTDANENKCGSTYADHMDGAGGSDVLWGSGGNNTVKGGTGDDTLSAYVGTDQIYPGDGQDTVYAGGGSDTITMYADGQPDIIDGQYGTDLVRVTSCHLDSVDQLKNVELMSRTAC
jgi:Ca2+-binding RTX toxin-like protein